MLKFFNDFSFSLLAVLWSRRSITRGPFPPKLQKRQKKKLLKSKERKIKRKNNKVTPVTIYPIARFKATNLDI